MLCVEGISLMLNIFREKRLSPNYRLVAPPNGELEVITVHEEVSQEYLQAWNARSECSIDFKDTAIRLWGRLAECQIHTSQIRVFHCTAGQASPKSCSSKNACFNRNS